MRDLKNFFQQMFLGSRGGPNRLRILAILKEKERNANELSTILGVDYSTADHHLNVLLKNNLIVRSSEGYAGMYKLSAISVENWQAIQEILEKLNKAETGGD